MPLRETTWEAPVSSDGHVEVWEGGRSSGLDLMRFHVAEVTLWPIHSVELVESYAQ